MAKNNSRFKADEEEHNWNTKSLKFFVLRSNSIGQSCQRDHTERAITRDQSMYKAFRLLIADWAGTGGLNTFCSHICEHRKVVYTSMLRENFDLSWEL